MLNYLLSRAKSLNKLVRRRGNSPVVYDNPYAQVIPPSERLFAIILPKCIIGRGISSHEAFEIFNPYLEKLAEIADTIYSSGAKSLSRNLSREQQQIKLDLEGETAKIQYFLFPQAQSYSPWKALGGIGQAVYSGILTITQNPLDFKNAGNLVNALLADFCIAYKSNPAQGSSRFQVFHNRGKEALNSDQSLLDVLGVHPTEACEYIFLPGAAAWGMVDLKR